MDEYLCRTAFLYCGGRNGTFDNLSDTRLFMISFMFLT